MIKAVIFDFDGVILESADIKTEAFRELFSGYPEHVEKITKYHMENGGISRYVKFRYIYENILGKNLSKKTKAELGKKFSKIVLDKVLAAPFVSGIKEFLDNNMERYRFFIASGTPEKELHDIVSRRGLLGYFKEVHGSPAEKADIINAIIKRNNLSRYEIAYIGDSESDRVAAEKTKVLYIERKKGRDLSGLEEILKKKR